MKQDILKIAGVKSEAEFYKKFPSEAAFMKVHGKAFKKAKMGASMVNKQLTQLTDFSNPPQAQYGIKQDELAFVDPITGLVQAPGRVVTQGQTDFLESGMPATTGQSQSSSLGKSDPSGIMQGVQNVVGGAQQWKEDAKMLKKYKMWGKIADLSGKAMGTRDRIKNKYVRPEDMVFDPNQVSPSYGTGYDVLSSAEDGMQVGGNLTEIQNMYNPGDIYSDMGYEPLDESSRVKQFADGGGLFGNWQNTATQFGAQNAGGLGGSLGNLIGGGSNQMTGASKTLGGIGQLAGTALGGPLGGVIGSGLGSLVGGFIGSGQEKKMQQQQQKISNLGFQQGAIGMQNQNSAFMEDGGEVGLKYLSHDWQPQVIAKFGDYDLKDLLREDETMDTLRSGGNLKDYSYTPPSEQAMETYAMGGNLQIDGRGDIDFMGYNPEAAKTGASGYIGISRGPSHDNGGFNVDYAGNKVEIEGGETVMEKRDGGSVDGENALNILGDMKMGNQAEAIAADVNKETLKKILKGRDIKDVKFKHLGNDIAKMTKRLNQAENKYINLADSSDGNSSTDLLQLNTAKAGLDGIKMQYKDLNNFQTGLVDLQTSYHDTAKEHGYDDTPKFLEDVKKGKLKQQAAAGGKFSQAQFGISQPFDPISRMNTYSPMVTSAGIKKQLEELNKKRSVKKGSSQRTEPVEEYVSVPEVTPYTPIPFAPPNPIDITDRWKQYLPKKDNVQIPFKPGFNSATARYEVAMKNNKQASEKAAETKTDSKSGKLSLTDAYNMLYPYIKPLIQNPLDPRQFAGDEYLLATNQLEAVQAQQFAPQLETPYSVSFQDQMNVNQADFNAMARQLGSNPAALAQLAAQKYAANTSVLGQQARANQEIQMGAYNRNRSLINEANLKNLAALDKQYERQSMAKSKTKAQTYEALSSIADKYARNRAETLAANVQANMYPDYAFGPKGRVMKTGLTQFNIPTIADYTSADLQKFADAKKIEETKGSKTTARNGSLVKAIKNL